MYYIKQILNEIYGDCELHQVSEDLQIVRCAHMLPMEAAVVAESTLPDKTISIVERIIKLTPIPLIKCPSYTIVKSGQCPYCTRVYFSVKGWR